VLQKELALIKQIDQRWLAEDIWERLDHLYCCARDIYRCCGTYLQRQQAAHLIRECDRLKAECGHQWGIEFGTIARGTPFDEEEWSRDFERLEKEIAEWQRRWN